MKVVGIKKAEGDYQGNHYCNFILYVTVPETKGLIAGVCPNTVKLKQSRMADFLNDLHLNKVEDLYNRDLVFYYDAYQNVSKIEEL